MGVGGRDVGGNLDNYNKLTTGISSHEYVFGNLNTWSRYQVSDLRKTKVKSRLILHINVKMLGSDDKSKMLGEIG